MKKKSVLIAMTCVLSFAMLAGCSSAETTTEGTMESSAMVEETETAENDVVDDQAAADEVAALIDAIYVQQRTEDTDAQCEAAKTAWDALTDAQKELVAGEYADPDYFGRDTGDATLDNPLNQDEIGENELLVVSFGTSFNDSRATDIGGIEKALQEANPDWSVRRAFTAQIIINHVQARDGEKIDNMEQALARAVANGVKNLVIQPTHLMHGAEYDELLEAVEAYQDQFETLKVAEPLLGEVGADITAINVDKETVARSIVAEAVSVAGFESVDAAAEEGTAFVLMGHGTSHTAKVTYNQMQAQMDALGLSNVFIGTVEGEPEDTACEVVIEKVKEAGFQKVILRPLMVVAGDHASNDMAGEDADSWKSQFEASGYFETIDAQVEGLGRIAEIQNVYIEHTADAIANGKNLSTATGTASAQALADGVYTAEFNTDSGMFHATEANEGKGVLTVKDGEMTLHVSLTSKNIVNLFVGKAEDAQKEGAELLNPSVDTVTYKDGMTEEVNGFDIPVPAIDQEFDVALIGKKGVWYDHKVSVSNPQKDSVELADGEYRIDVTLEGGSGRASVESPAQIKVTDGQIYATIVWSSSNYDYMIVDNQKYEPVNTEGNSTFEIPVSSLDSKISVKGDTIAMGTPHEIDYTLYFDHTSLR